MDDIDIFEGSIQQTASPIQFLSITSKFVGRRKIHVCVHDWRCVKKYLPTTLFTFKSKMRLHVFRGTFWSIVMSSQRYNSANYRLWTLPIRNRQVRTKKGLKFYADGVSQNLRGLASGGIEAERPRGTKKLWKALTCTFSVLGIGTDTTLAQIARLLPERTSIAFVLRYRQSTPRRSMK